MKNDDRGSVVVIVALMMVVLLGFSALVVDVGVTYGQERKLQNALNAAALAGGLQLPDEGNALNAANQNIQLNGYKPSDIKVTFLNNDSTINIVGTQIVNTIFAKVFGASSVTLTIHSAASKTGAPPAFNYALFSGDTNNYMGLNGSSYSITGSVHSNAGMWINGTGLNVTGTCDAPREIGINGSNSSFGTVEASPIVVNGSNILIGTKIRQSASIIDMPDFSSTIKSAAQQGGTYYNGDQNYNGNDIGLSTPIYVNGNVNFNGSSSFYGNSTIVATGNIAFDGNVSNDSSNDAICLYSANGSIYFNGSGLNINGIVYAPHGQIIINGQNTTVNGRLIANDIYINGGGLTIISNPNDLTSLPIKQSVKLTVPTN